MKPIHILLLSAMAALLPAAAMSQDAAAFPAKPIKLVVPFTSGGPTDTIARKLADQVRQRLNATIVIDNRPGASAIIGTDAVAKAPADGYTLLMGVTAGIVQVPWLQSKLPYDPMKDLVPIAYVAQLPTALIVPTALQINSYEELVAYIKTHAGGISYASVGHGSSHHIFGEMLSAKLNARAVHVPYKGDGPALADLVPGRIQYMFSSVFEAINFQQQGKVRILAITGNSRLPTIPKVPTMEELGLPGFDMSGFSAVFVPAGTPRAISDKLGEAFAEAVRSVPFTQYLETNGLAAGNLNPEQFAAQLRRDYASWGQVIKANNIRLD